MIDHIISTAKSIHIAGHEISQVFRGNDRIWTKCMFTVTYRTSGTKHIAGKEIQVQADTPVTVIIDDVTSLKETFYNIDTEDISSIDCSRANTRGCLDFEKMFMECTGYEPIDHLDLSSFDFSKASSFKSMFDNMYMTSLTLPDSEIKGPANLERMFYCCQMLSQINGKIKARDITNVYQMFAGCESLTNIDFSEMNTSKCTDFCQMLASTAFQTFDDSNLDMSNAVSLEGMFSRCQNLTSANFNSLIGRYVKNTSSMFANCRNLQSVNMPNFGNTYPRKVNNMMDMFYNCKKLKSVSIPKMKTDDECNMATAFCDCVELETLDISSFTFKSGPKSMMFCNCNKLSKITCTADFKAKCLANADLINLPAAMREGGSGTWVIV